MDNECMRGLNAKLYKDTGCPDCDKLPGVEMCLKHRLEYADSRVVSWMDEVERIEQEIKKKEKENA